MNIYDTEQNIIGSITCAFKCIVLHTKNEDNVDVNILYNYNKYKDLLSWIESKSSFVEKDRILEELKVNSTEVKKLDNLNKKVKKPTSQISMF